MTSDCGVTSNDDALRCYFTTSYAREFLYIDLSGSAQNLPSAFSKDLLTISNPSTSYEQFGSALKGGP